ncbi:MAG TPA: RNA polymerase sigma factor [Planctomycetota bacterium]|nr:RNA polymerase sigma factor [Planctomycetota bacterium]
MTTVDPRRTIEAIWRIESAKLIARLARIVRDVGRAEELAQEAFVAALEQWPSSGVPEKPGAWLMATAKHRALDHLRRDRLHGKKQEELARRLEAKQESPSSELDDALDDEIGDDLLRLILTACHPELAEEARVALTLRLVGGLTTEEIARAFLLPVATIAQRIVRAKRTLAEKNVTFESPRGAELSERLSSALAVVYLVFNEGYAATTGDVWIRPALCDEALRLGRIIAELVPGEREAHGLTALMEFQASRLRARVGSTGEPILLNDQNRARWDHLLIQRGLRSLARADALGGSPGPYELQAAIAACHATARAAEETDWGRIVALYGELSARLRSPVVELNRAVAVSRQDGPAKGLEIVDALVAEGSLDGYHLLPSVRGDLLQKLGRLDEARADFEAAASLATNLRERALLIDRARSCDASRPTSSG